MMQVIIAAFILSPLVRLVWKIFRKLVSVCGLPKVPQLRLSLRGSLLLFSCTYLLSALVGWLAG